MLKVVLVAAFMGLGSAANQRFADTVHPPQPDRLPARQDLSSEQTTATATVAEETAFVTLSATDSAISGSPETGTSTTVVDTAGVTPSPTDSPSLESEGFQPSQVYSFDSQSRIIFPRPPPLSSASIWSYSQPPIPSQTLSSPPELFTAGLSPLTPPRPQERFYKFLLGYSAGAPDGFHRRMTTINNMFPGPLIEGYKGDTITIEVTNSLDEPQGIHWHGIVNNHTNYMDGVPGVSQCSIMPGKTFTYRFVLEGETGTYWYHSHYGNTMADGVYGGFLVHSADDSLKITPSLNTEIDFDDRDSIGYNDDRVVYLSDHLHDQSELVASRLREWGEGYEGSNAPGMPHSILINSIGQTDCSVAQMGVQCDQTNPSEVRAKLGSVVRLRLINPSSHTHLRFSIDQHVLKVVEMDDTPIQPIYLHELQIDPGQRYSVLVHLNQASTTSAFWMRAAVGSACFPNGRPMTGHGILRYTGKDGFVWNNDLPKTAPWPDLKDPMRTPCVDLDMDYDVRPLIPEDAPARTFATGQFDSQVGNFLDLQGNPFNGFTWNAHNNGPNQNESKWVTYTNYINNPFLATVENGGQVNQSRIATVTFNEMGAADIIINQLDNGVSHPFHLHGRKFFIVGRGSGTLQAADLPNQKLNLINPPRRDTLTMPSSSWAILRVITDTPGVWPIHCHIGWHLAKGKMGIVVIRPDAVQQFERPQEWLDLCKGLDPNELGPARRNYRPPQARRLAEDVESSTDIAAPSPAQVSAIRETPIDFSAQAPDAALAYQNLTGSPEEAFKTKGIVSRDVVVGNGTSPLDSTEQQSIPQLL